MSENFHAGQVPKHGAEDTVIVGDSCEHSCEYSDSVKGLTKQHNMFSSAQLTFSI
jgi:hypothetical protein